MAYIVAHGIKLANNSFIKDLVVDVATVDYAGAQLTEGKMWYNSTERVFKVVRKDAEGVLFVDSISSQTDMDDFKLLLASQNVGEGSAFVGFEGATGINNKFSLTADSLDASIKAIVQAIDTEIKNREDASTTAVADLQTQIDTEEAARIAADGVLQTAIDNEVTARTNADAALQTAIDNEVTARTNADTAITTDITTNYLNKTTTADQTVAGNVAFQKDIVVTGNLTVNGTTTTINTAELNVADNQVVLNSDFTTGTATQNAGIQVMRGDAGVLDIVMFDEADDKVKVSVYDATLNEGAGGFKLEAVVTASSFDTNTTEIWNAISAEEAARISADNTLQSNIDVEAATRLANDNTLQSNIDSEIANRTAADAAIQAELDATQVGAGLEVNGTYTANATANYIATATSLKDADDKLDAAIKAEETARIAADGTLQSAINAETAARIAADGDLSTLSTSVKTDLVSAINEVAGLAGTGTAGVQAELDATQVGAGLEANGSYVANATANYIATATSLKDADDKLDAAIKAEETARIAADGTLTTNLANEVTRATTAETTLQSNIDAEATARASGDSALQDAINNVATDVFTNYLNKTSATEQTVASKVTFQDEVVITGNLTVNGTTTTINTTELAIADNQIVLNSDYTTGAPVANAGIQVLRGDEGLLDIITFDESDDKVKVSVYDATLNEGAGGFKLEAVVTASSFASNTDDLWTAINGEIYDRGVADAAIQAELDATQVGAGLGTDGAYTADATTNFITTATSLMNADKMLDTAIKAEETARIAAITAEETARTTADSTLQSNITAEETARIAADNALQANITAEESARIAADNALSASIAAINAKVFQYDGSVAAATHTITHNLATNFVTVQVWVYDEVAMQYKNDLCAVTQTSNNAVVVELTAAYKIIAVVTAA